jgi:hypothetical protein
MNGDEPIIGWRMWRVLDWRAPSPHLGSMTYMGGNHWPSGRAPASETGVPALSGTCGYHAHKTKEQVHLAFGYTLTEVHRRTGLVYAWGEVYLWGKVVEHENGYRAQFAYPKRLWVTKPAIVGMEVPDYPSMLRRLYGVEAAWAPDVQEPEPFCAGSAEKTLIDKLRVAWEWL